MARRRLMGLFKIILTLFVIIFIGGNIFLVFALIMNGENFAEDDDAQEEFIKQYAEKKRQEREAEELKKKRKGKNNGKSI